MAYELINSGPVTPHRMHALIQLLGRQPEWNRAELLNLIQPTNIDAKQQVAKDVLAALGHLGVVDRAGDRVMLLPVAKGLDDLQQFRRFLHASVAKARNESFPNYRFSLFTAWYATKSEEVFTVNNDELVVRFNNQIPFDSEDRAMNMTKFNTWRTLAAFLEYGWPYASKIAPDATNRLRPEIPGLIPESGDVPFSTFITRLSAACPELDHGELFRLAWNHSRSESLGRQLSMMLSNGLRRLHADGTIALGRVPDAGEIWRLYPAAGFRLDEITHIRRGVNV